MSQAVPIFCVSSFSGLPAGFIRHRSKDCFSVRLLRPRAAVFTECVAITRLCRLWQHAVVESCHDKFCFSRKTAHETPFSNWASAREGIAWNRENSVCLLTDGKSKTLAGHW